MDDLIRGLEIAGTGIGVVFAALVSLAVVTMLLGRALRSVGAEPQAEAAEPPAEPVESPAPQDAGPDHAMVAAMTAAVQFVRRGFRSSGAAGGPRTTTEVAGAWRMQGRQALMSSQGNRVRPRDSRR